MEKKMKMKYYNIINEEIIENIGDEKQEIK